MFGLLTPSPVTVMIVLGLGVMFFGKNLPDIARQVGLAFLEFKKGMNEFTSVLDMKESVRGGTSSSQVRKEVSSIVEADRESDFGVKFEPPSEG